jgi:hypothetical protein
MLNYSDNTAHRLGMRVWRAYHWLTFGYGLILMITGLGIAEILMTLHTATASTFSQYGIVARSATQSPLLVLAGALIVTGISTAQPWPVAGGWALRGGAVVAFLFSSLSRYSHVLHERVLFGLGWTLFYLVMPVTLLGCPPIGPQPAVKALKRMAWVGLISVIAKLLVHVVVALRDTWIALGTQADLPRGELVRQAVRERPVEALSLACVVAVVIIVSRKGLTPSIGWLTFGLMLLTTFHLAPISGTDMIFSGSQVLQRVGLALLVLFGLLANAPAWLMPIAIVAAQALEKASPRPMDDLQAAA